MKIGGPIEARRYPVQPAQQTTFPPMKIGGPIEAKKRSNGIWHILYISTDENRWPH